MVSRVSPIIFLFSFLFAWACFGQNGLSRISGTVTDASGAVVAGANVAATDDATGVKYTQKTTAAGLYSFPSLPVGSYTVSVESPGFKTSSRTHNVLEVNTPLAIDLTLEVGSAAETVSVEATAEALQTNTATIGDVVTQKAIQDLPLNGRNPLTLITLEPGVVQRSNGGAGSGIHVNGSRDRAYNVTIDGIEANESTVPNPVSNLYRLNPDNVEEYKVTTNNATPEEGRNSGASTAIATRSGTNQIHGVAFEFLRNTDLNASDFFANAQGTPKPDIKLHQFGFEVGGPIIRNKTFFFGGWQQQKAKFTQPVDQTLGNIPVVYTPEALAGTFRYFVPDANNAFVLNGQKITRTVPQLVNGATGALQPGVRNCASPSDTNCIGSYNIFANDPRKIGLDPKIGALLKSLPHSNVYTNGDGLNTAGYEWNPPTQQNGPAYTARIDHTFNERNNLFVRYLQSTLNTLQGDPLNGRPQVYPGFPPEGEVFRNTKNLAISYRRVFSPSVVNEFTAGFARFVFLFTQGEANPAFPDVPPYVFNFATSPYTNTPHSARAVTTPQFLDNLNIVKGAHVVRTGLNVRFYEHNDNRGQPGGITVTPSLSFSATTRPPTGFTLPTRIDPTDVNNLNGTINELLGIPARLSQVFLGDLKSDTFLPLRTGKSVSLWDQGTRLKQYNFYLQDEWRIRQNLVLNYGARWEINTAPSEAAGRVYVPDKPVDGSQGPVSFVKADRWYRNNNIGAIGPRVGIAWSPRNSQKTVIRAGYGIAFDPVSSFQVTAVAGRVPGLTTSCSATVGGSTTPGCPGVPDIRIGEGFPLALAPPTTKPSSFLTLPAVTLNNAPSLAVFDPNLKLPTVHEWNLTVQHELPGSVVIQAGYIGRRGTRLMRAYDINQIKCGPDSAIVPRASAEQCEGLQSGRHGLPGGRDAASRAADRPGNRDQQFRQHQHHEERPAIERGGEFRGPHRADHPQCASASEPAIRDHHVSRFGRRLLLSQLPVHGAKAVQFRFADGASLHFWQVDRRPVGRSRRRVLGGRSQYHELAHSDRYPGLAQRARALRFRPHARAHDELRIRFAVRTRKIVRGQCAASGEPDRWRLEPERDLYFHDRRALQRSQRREDFEFLPRIASGYRGGKAANRLVRSAAVRGAAGVQGCERVRRAGSGRRWRGPEHFRRVQLQQRRFKPGQAIQFHRKYLSAVPRGGVQRAQSRELRQPARCLFGFAQLQIQFIRADLLRRGGAAVHADRGANGRSGARDPVGFEALLVAGHGDAIFGRRAPNSQSSATPASTAAV
ncbi:MAG: carboxypeptidase regulatory-like domain-containing protein [Bryobacteraceae bacterium]